MYGTESLLDFHQRAHRSLSTLLEHCGELTDDELNRELAGFGFATVRLQIHHQIGAEKYWLGVLEGRIDADEDEQLYPTLASLSTYRGQIQALTEAYLRGATGEELNQPRMMTTWGGREKLLVPAQVILRTQAHLYHHIGQISAMCRLLGKPSPGADYPID